MKLFNSKLGQMVYLDEPTRPRHRSVIVRLSDIIGLKKSYQMVDSRFKTIFTVILNVNVGESNVFPVDEDTYNEISEYLEISEVE